VDTEDEVLVIRRPWNDPSVLLEVPTDRAGRRSLIDALNRVTLPEQLSAIYHRGPASLEFIYTASRIDPDLEGRSFDYQFNGSNYRCEFGESSSELLAIALSSRPAGASRTGYRNLESYHVVMHSTAGAAHIGRPTSFWIRGIKWNADEVLELVRHLNFYLRYFDRRSPLIDTHELLESGRRVTPMVRYPRGAFPSSIRSRNIDPFLIDLSEIAWSGDPLTRFLYSYQILEYISFYYMQEATALRLRMILARPDLPSDVGHAAREIFDAVTESKIDDDAKMQAIIRQLVPPDALWAQVEPELDFFSAETRFEGGFSLQAWLKRDWTVEDFNVGWMPSFHYTIRNLRNALVHAREARMSRSIAPTEENYLKLVPWAHLVRIAASEAITNSEL
jgi:hypothetical protein